MKKFGKLKLFGLLIFLSAALVFIGVNFLESGKVPKWDWKVEIPTLTTATGLNVYGNSPPPIPGGYAVFEKNDFVKMGVQRGEDSETGGIFYHFYFRVYNNDKGYSIGLQNLDFCGCKTRCEDSWCCVFPPAALPTGEDCDGLDCPEPICGGGIGHLCMQDFMEREHPDFGYQVVAIRMYIYCDIEAIPPGGSVPADGRMWQFDIWNTSAPLLVGNEEYHNIICRYSLLLEDVIIERSSEEEDGGNTWTIFVNQDGSASTLYEGNVKLLAFWEFYEKAVKEPKGKSDKYKISSEDCYALGGRTVFKFESRWTRSETKKGRPSK